MPRPIGLMMRLLSSGGYPTPCANVTESLLQLMHECERPLTKYGIELPTSIKHALEIDKKNGNHFWRDAIDKEMKNVSIAFEILEENQHLPPGYTRASAHIIFDVKMDFTRKARWVLDGHRTPDPEGSTYAGLMRHSTVLMSWPPTYEMLIFRPQCHRNISSFVALNLVWRTLEREL